MSHRVSRFSALALALACVLAAGCQDKERPRPVTGTLAAAPAR